MDYSISTWHGDRAWYADVWLSRGRSDECVHSTHAQPSEESAVAVAQAWVDGQRRANGMKVAAV